MDKHLPDDLFRDIERPAPALRIGHANADRSATFADATEKTHHIAHGRFGVSFCRLYTRDKMTSIPISPWTTCGANPCIHDEEAEHGSH